MSLEIGKVIDGKVAGITNFGAFIEIGEGKTGLVHISEVAREYVKDIREYLKEGQQVKVKVVSCEPNGKIGLSIRKVLEEEAAKRAKIPIEIDWSSQKSSGGLSFEDKMLKFKQDSDEKMQDFKRSIDSKRGSGKRGAGAF